MPNSHDPEIRDLMERASAATRKEWGIMRNEHETLLQDQASIWKKQGKSAVQMTERGASLRAELEEKEQRFIEAVREQEQQGLDALQQQEVQKSRFFADEGYKHEQAAKDEAMRSQFVTAELQKNMDSPAVQNFLDEQAKQERWAQFQREEQERSQEIADQQAKGTLQPVEREKVIEAERRRLVADLKEAEKRIEELRKEEMALTEAKCGRDNFDSEDMAREMAAKDEELRRIAEQDKERIRREAAERLQRMLEPYDRTR